MSRSSDKEYMALAFEEGKKARLHSSPNPWVGCVIVKDGQIIGSGHTSPPGQAHAEIMALSETGDEARGATLYVTLEPCSHEGRTPPCVDALIKAGITRVVIAVADPDHQVNGKGLSKLKDAGISVDTGICQNLAEKELEAYFYHRKTKMPFCILKTAMSLDGRVTAPDGSSQWITCKKARADGHRLRAESQAIIIGSETAIKDQPRLTVRNHAAPHTPPIRVLLDSRGRVKAGGPLFDQSLGQTIVYTTSKADPNNLLHWKKRGIGIVEVMASATGVGVHLPQVMKDLGSRGVIQALIEGGPTLHGECIRQGFVNQFHVTIGNCLLGSEGKGVFGGNFTDSIANAPRFQLESATPFGDCVKLIFTSVST